MEWPSVSVVVPAYNASRFLADAVSSVRRQTVPAAELILVDDGSSDRTAETASALGARVLSILHAGVAVARNAGVAASSGEFIAFLDADDMWSPEKLERQLLLATANPDAGVVMARQGYLFDGEVPAWFRGPRDGSSEPGYQPSNWLVRRSTWVHVGGFSEGVTHSEDTDWLARASDLGVRVVMVDEPLTIHRIHDQNASGLAVEVRAGVLQALRSSVQRKRALGQET